jgi:hypothetical protein
MRPRADTLCTTPYMCPPAPPGLSQGDTAPRHIADGRIHAVRSIGSPDRLRHLARGRS